MPNITTTGTYSSSTDGFEFLTPLRETRVLLFSSGTLPTTLEVQYIDDTGVARTLEGGTITTLPTSLLLWPFNRPLQIKVTGGTPNFNVCEG